MLGFLKLFKKPESQNPSWEENSIMEYVRSARTPYVWRKDEITTQQLPSAEKMAHDHLYEQGHWMINKRVPVLKPIMKEKVEAYKNVLVMILYYGEYDEYICYGLTFFKKSRKHWIYLGENNEQKMQKIPPIEENMIRFTDESGKKREEPCQGREEYYFTW